MWNCLGRPFFSFQVVQPPNPYEEEKGETRSTNSTAETTPTEPRVNTIQKLMKHPQRSLDRINTFINALAESRLSVSIHAYKPPVMFLNFMFFRIHM